MINGKYYEDMVAGDTLETNSRTVTETDLVNFISTCGFMEPLFLDAGHAEEAGYEGRLLPGALVYALAEGLILQTNIISGTGMAFMGMKMTVKAPTRVGDTIRVHVETIEVRASKDPKRGVVTSVCSVLNQSNETVLVFEPVRLIRGRDYGAQSPV